VGGTDWPITIRRLPSPPPLTYHWHGILGLKLSPLVLITGFHSTNHVLVSIGTVFSLPERLAMYRKKRSVLKGQITGQYSTVHCSGCNPIPKANIFR
jgi:hypothetical protein